MIPRFRGYDVENENPKIPFNETKVYKEMVDAKILKNINENKLVRGVNSLDDYDEDGYPVTYKKTFGVGFYIICAILLIFLCLWLNFTIRCMCCPKRK